MNGGTPSDSPVEVVADGGSGPTLHLTHVKGGCCEVCGHLVRMVENLKQVKMQREAAKGD